MKAILGCLMCLVLTLSQAFAISGGPFGRFGPSTFTGTYAGAFTPVFDPVIGMADVSLGIFSLAIASQGLHTGQTPGNSVVGAVVIFRHGIVYTGWPRLPPPAISPPPGGVTPPPGSTAPGIIGTADPFTGQLRAIVSTYATLPDTGVASGTFDTTRIVPTENGLLSIGLIRGGAAITYRSTDPIGNSGEPIRYKVRGFKQSDSN